MFEYWNYLSKIGGSRNVAFYVDGDGNFHPNCKITSDVELPELTDELKEKAAYNEDDGDRLYDFDSIAWHFAELEEK